MYLRGRIIRNELEKRLIFLLLACSLSLFRVAAQMVQGEVTDGSTGEPLPAVHVYYMDDKSTLVSTDINGKYKIAFRKGTLVFSMMGFDTKALEVKSAQKLNVKLQETASSLMEIKVETKRKKYSRKNNPAVEMMRKVIAAKKSSNLRLHDYLSYMKYEKMTMSLNEFTDKVFEDDHFKHLPFLKEHVEVYPETGKLILPLTMEEKVSQIIYRKEPKTEKSIIIGQRNEGVHNLINTGEIFTGMLSDCFTDIDIYQDQVRLLQYPFTSPISTASAISFYRYFIVDTLMVGKQKCYQVDFTPNNPQDFGFSGSLFILADSTWRLKRAEIGIPSRSDVNFVEQMTIQQDFEPLPSGEQVVVNNKMWVQMELASWLQKFQVERVVKYSGWDFTEIPDRTFRFKGDTKLEASAEMRDETFWEEQRPTPLTKGEDEMDQFMNRLYNIKGFKQIIWVAKAFIENFVETSVNPEHPSKVDIGPINAMLGTNSVEGFHLRASAQTTANLNPHWFLRGNVKYGFGDKRWKGLGEVTYSFKKKDYLPREYPVRNLTFNYENDIGSPSDVHMPTDRDNVFIALKWAPVRHMTYFERYNLTYDWEWENGLRLPAHERHGRPRAGCLDELAQDNVHTSVGRPEIPARSHLHQHEAAAADDQLRRTHHGTVAHRGHQGTAGWRVCVQLYGGHAVQEVLAAFVGQDGLHDKGRHTVEQGALPLPDHAGGQPELHQGGLYIQPHPQYGVPHRQVCLADDVVGPQWKDIQPHPAHKGTQVEGVYRSELPVGPAYRQEQPVPAPELQRPEADVLPGDVPQRRHVRLCLAHHGPEETLRRVGVRNSQYLQDLPH